MRSTVEFSGVNSCQDLAWHREDGNPPSPVVVTLLGVTLSLPVRNDNAPSPVGRDNPRVPNGTQKSVQSQKGGGCPRPEHLSVDASRSFPTSQLVYCFPSSLGWVDHSLQVVLIPDSVDIPGKLSVGIVHTIQTQSSEPIGPGFPIPRQCRVMSRFQCRTAGLGPR